MNTMNDSRQRKNVRPVLRRALLAFCSLILALPVMIATAPAKSQQTPRIEVAFVLDTTGSMSGLIEGAKLKIWSIANQMIAADPTPQLSIGLVAYRDRGDAYVTEVHDLSDDIDAVYGRLQGFSAGGGGDTPESVNQALLESVEKLSWSRERDVLKIVFLVGDCPPHMDYDEVRYPEICRRAVGRDLIINTVQCGSHAQTTPIWQEIARLAEGRFVAIAQSGGMEVIEAPQDEELARLNASLGRTLVPYGEAERRSAVMAKQRAAEVAAAPAVADRLAYNAATGKSVQGGGDLVDALAADAVELESLSAKDLPPEMRGLDIAQQRAYVAKKSAEREQIQRRIDELLAARADYVKAEQERRAKGGGGSSFDREIARMLREQARRKGIQFAAE